MTNANFRIKNGLYVVEDTTSSGNLTLLDGEVKSDADLTINPDAVSGTDTAGNDMIIRGGAGTGQGNGGNIIFKVADSSGQASGSSVNSHGTTALTINEVGNATFGATLIIPDGGTIGSVTDSSAITIASTGIVTFNDNIVLPNTGTIGPAGDTNAIQLNIGTTAFTATTASTSTTTGAVTVAGGLGVAADIVVGDDLKLLSDSAVINFGTDSDVALTHVHNVGLQLSTTATSGAVPIFEIYQDETDANGGVLRFKKEAGSVNTADNDKLGVIQFFGDDDGGTSTNMGTIEGRIQDASNDDELGRLMLRPRADSGGAGGIIIDGLTVEGLLNKKHHITVAVGGNRSGDATGYVESDAGGVVSLFQAPTDNTDFGAEHYAATGGAGTKVAFSVLPAVNIGGGSTPRTFSATATSGGSAANYTTNLFVNGTGYTEARISSVLAQKETYRHPGLGSALVLETVDDENFNGIYFSRDTSNALSWTAQDMSSDLATEGTWGAGWLTEGTDFSIGFHAAKYDSCAIQEAGTTQLNPLVAGKSLLRITTAGNMGIKSVPSSTATVQVGASGETSVGGVIGIESGSSAPATTTNRLYNNAGALYWGTTDLTAAGASTLGGLTDVTITGTPADGEILIYSSTTSVFENATISGTANEVEVTNAAGSITLGLPNDVTITGDLTVSGNDLTFGNGATIVNTDANTLTITEATTAFSGDIQVNGNDIKSSTGATAITLSGADVTVAGNLTVNGTTTAVNTTNMTVEDALIELGIVDGAAPSSDTSYDLGMLVNYYSSSAAKKAGFYWDSDTTAWSLSEVVTEGGGQLLTPTAGATEMRYLYDATNYFSIDVAANGATTLSTVDSDGAIGHLTLDSDGDIILDADGANITFKDDGTAILDFVLAASNVTLDSVGDITLDVADGKDVLLHEAGIVYASIGQGSVDIANIADTAGATTIDTFDCSVYPTTKYLILVEDVTNNNYLSTEILLLGDDQPATAVGYLTQYALLYNDTELGTFSATGSGNNVSLQYDPSDTAGTANHKVRVVATRIAALS